MTEPAVISVMIADNHEILRRGLADFLSTCPGTTLAGQADSLSDAVRLCRKLKPDVLLVDLMMSDMDGIDAIRMIRRDCPRTHIIVLTSCDDERVIQAAIQAGVTSYLMNHVATDALAMAIYDANAGQSTLSPEASQALVRVQQQRMDSAFNLTRREREVLGLMAEGRRNTEIALALTVSRSTVKKHVSNILTKLNSGSRTEAVAVAMQHQLVSRAGTPGRYEALSSD